MNTSSYPIFAPAAVSPLSAQIQNALCTRRSPWRVPAGSAEAEVRPAPFAAPFTPVCGVVLDCGGGLWRVEMGGMDAIRRHPALAGLAPDAVLPEPVAMAALAAVAEPALSMLGTFLGGPAAIRTAGVLPAASPDKGPFAGLPQPVCAFTLEVVLPEEGVLPAETIPIRVGLPDAKTANALADRLFALPRHGRDAAAEAVFADVLFPVGIVAGEMRLGAADLAALETGDILFPESYSAADGRVSLRLFAGRGAVWTALCEVKDGMAAIIENPTVSQEHPMSEQENHTRDDIEVTLSFELERRLMTLGDLCALAPGYTFALAADKSAPVSLCANGKVIGKGRLVDMNGNLGVQITEIR